MYSNAVRAGIYCRISRDPDDTRLGVERQRQDCKKLAVDKGWEVAAIYIDNDVSAYSGKPRPEYIRLLADIADGTINAVVVWHLDRLHRRPIELEEFMQLCDAKRVELATVHGDIDLSNSSGRLEARIMGVVARHESERKSERIKRAFLERAKSPDDTYLFGNRPFGYSADGMTIVPQEAQVIRKSIAQILAGESLRAVCLDLNHKGLRTKSGNQWTHYPLKTILCNPRNAGLRQRADIGVVRGKWPAIISEQEWKRVTAILRDPSRGNKVGAPRRHLLSGILRCGECGHGLASHKAGGQRNYRNYICPIPPYGCGRLSIKASQVELFVTEAVLDIFQDPSLSTVFDENEGEAAALQAIESDRALLQKLAVLFSDRKITDEEWMSARAPIEARISAAQAVVVESSRTTLAQRFKHKGKDLRAAWPSLDVEKQRAIIESVIDQIVVKRVGRGKPRRSSRLQVVLKY